MSKAALNALVALVEDDLFQVNETIIERMHSRVELISQIAHHLIAAGGKRIRPLLTLACAHLCGYKGRDHVKLAACVEFIHTATLLHDDVVDESRLRRGRDSANAVWDNKAPVLAGDFLFSRTFEMMVEIGSLPAMATLSRASSVLAEGEVFQLITSNDTSTSEQDYLEVIQGKTAELFAAACKLGGEVANVESDLIADLYAFGNALGMAFQLVDDYLDYAADEQDLGKAVGDDFREGKITLPVILAVARAENDEERDFWKRTMEEVEQNDDDLPYAMTLLKKYNTLEETRERARLYGAQAHAALAPFPEGAFKQALRGIVDFCIERAY